MGLWKGSIPTPPFAETLDFQPLKVERAKVQFQFVPQEFHYNPIGSVHGGIISTALDTVMGCALHTLLQHGFLYTILELKVNFTKALRVGKVIAEGRVLHFGKTTALLEADLKGEDGTLYSYGTSTCILLAQK